MTNLFGKWLDDQPVRQTRNGFQSNVAKIKSKWSCLRTKARMKMVLLLASRVYAKWVSSCKWWLGKKEIDDAVEGMMTDFPVPKDECEKGEDGRATRAKKTRRRFAHMRKAVEWGNEVGKLWVQNDDDSVHGGRFGEMELAER